MAISKNEGKEREANQLSLRKPRKSIREEERKV